MTDNKQAMIDEIRAHAAKSYDLIYVAQGDQLTDEHLAKIIEAGEYWDLTDEWYFEHRVDRRDEIIAELLREHWERNATDEELDEGYEDNLDVPDDLREALEELVEDRDESDPLKDLLRNTGKILWRYLVEIDEDENAAHFLARVGLPVTMTNLATAQVALMCGDVNESPWLLWYGYAEEPLMAALNSSWGNSSAPDTISLTDPEVVFLDTMNGSGDSGQFVGTITVPFKPAHLTPDAGPGGYGWDSVASVHKPYYNNEPTFEKIDVKERIQTLSRQLRRCA